MVKDYVEMLMARQKDIQIKIQFLGARKKLPVGVNLKY